MTKVHINFNVFEKNGSEYLNFSNELNDIINNLKEIEKNLKDNWISSNSDIYNVLLNKHINEIQVDANRMKKYGDTILGINDDFKQTDMEYAKRNAMENVEDTYGRK